MSRDCDTNTSSRIGNSLSRQPAIGNRKQLVELPTYVDGRHAHVFGLQLSGVVRATVCDRRWSLPRENRTPRDF